MLLHMSKYWALPGEDMQCLMRNKPGKLQKNGHRDFKKM